MYNNKHLVSKSLFIIILILFATVAGFYLSNIVKWTNYPDWGWSLRTATGIKVVGIVREHGLAAGLQVGDEFLKIKGQT